MNNRRERLHRALDCVMDRAAAKDALTTMTNFGYGRGRSKELDAALDAIKKLYEEREAAMEKVKGLERRIVEANAVWRKLDCAYVKAHPDAHDASRARDAKDALDDRQFLDLMEKVGRLRDSTRSLKWPGDDNPKVQQASTDTYNATMSKVKTLIASSGISPQEFRKRATKVATKAGRRINLNWVESLGAHDASRAGDAAKIAYVKNRFYADKVSPDMDHNVGGEWLSPGKQLTSFDASDKGVFFKDAYGTIYHVDFRDCNKNLTAKKPK